MLTRSTPKYLDYTINAEPNSEPSDSPGRPLQAPEDTAYSLH